MTQLSGGTAPADPDNTTRSSLPGSAMEILETIGGASGGKFELFVANDGPDIATTTIAAVKPRQQPRRPAAPRHSK